MHDLCEKMASGARVSRRSDRSAPRCDTRATFAGGHSGRNRFPASSRSFLVTKESRVIIKSTPRFSPVPRVRDLKRIRPSLCFKKAKISIL